MRNLLILIAALIFSGILFFVILNRSQPLKTPQVQTIESAAFQNVVFVQDFEASGVYIYLVFPFGEANNPFDEGLAHYVEHLAWISTFGRDEAKKHRHSNAWTTHLSTGYWQVIDAHDLVRAYLSYQSPYQLTQNSLWKNVI